MRAANRHMAVSGYRDRAVGRVAVAPDDVGGEARRVREVERDDGSAERHVFDGGNVGERHVLRIVKAGHVGSVPERVQVLAAAREGNLQREIALLS